MFKRKNKNLTKIQERINELKEDIQRYSLKIKDLERDLQDRETTIKKEIEELEMRIKECQLLIQNYEEEKTFLQNPSKRKETNSLGKEKR